MPIERIEITISPSKDVPSDIVRVLIFSRDTKQWVSSEGGLFPSEIKLIAQIDKLRHDNPLQERKE